MHLRLTLVRLFVGATFVVTLSAGVTFWTVLRSSERSIVERSEAQRDAEARRIADELTADLGVATQSLEAIERALYTGALRLGDPDLVEAQLFSELVDHPTLSDITLTHADSLGFDDDGQARLAPEGRWQVSVFRASSAPSSEALTRRIEVRDGQFFADLRRRPHHGVLLETPFERGPAVRDPTDHPTFQTTASRDNRGRALWSDLSWSELDAALPQTERRVVVTVQKALEDAPGHLVGVLRVGLLARTIDDLLRAHDTDTPSRVTLSDSDGRLVARLDPRDRVVLQGDDLRVVATSAPPQVTAALQPPLRSRSLEVGGVKYLATFRELDGTQEWVAGVIVPEGYYTRDLRSLRDRFLLAMAGIAAVVFLVGGYVLRQLRRSLGRIVDATSRMRRFDFAPADAHAPLYDIAKVMESVERAKTSMRALGKYVPIDLVRQLYDSNREPELGGDLVEVSLMFTDIEGFTTLAERLAPDALANALGAYLEAMTRGVTSTGGTIDKFIGDAVMVFWNAPTPLPDHARQACRAALACMRETRSLYASSAWAGLPPLFTRFGLHTARVMVGHFGAPNRLAYTALGDGVNVAARLEPLCKQYGVAALASEAIVEQAGEGLVFRLIDRVAVKGKQQGVKVYELLGEASNPGEYVDALATARAYEAALEAYFARDFSRARALFVAIESDPPSRVMLARCETMLRRPPPPDWNGVYVATSK